ncbi:hypothetical protein GCM10022403_056690 [Streptomyces coacervatus]|uniref:MmpS family membrane protein n=1 Tax=Streptomyces coacervatus TaxID=647381 RepID=A0ABP7IDM1_9ACTN|nr:hypothetical protein [Streptomyces coacervatus]MDF2268967.1 hypothetical protein [Streptomyces coacervatus]
MPSTEKESTAGLDRRGLGIAAAVVAACGGLVLYGVLNTPDAPKKPDVPTAAVTYEVTGEGKADISYESGGKQASVARAAQLPWRRTVRVPLGHAPLVAITLGEKGGRAGCSLAVDGRHVQAASAYGRYGRATCQSEPASPEAAATATATAE